MEWLRTSMNFKTSSCGCCLIIRKRQIATGRTIWEGWVGEKLGEFDSAKKARLACEKAHENVRCEG